MLQMVRKSISAFGDIYWRTCIVFWTTYPPTNRMPTWKQKMDAIGHSSTASIWLLEVCVVNTVCMCGGMGGLRECVTVCVCVCVCVEGGLRESVWDSVCVCVWRGGWERVCETLCVCVLGEGGIEKYAIILYFAHLTCLQKLTCINYVDEYLLTCHWH